MAQPAEHIVHIMGRGAERPQCGMKRGGSGLSKRALQATVQQRDYCEADRPKGDRWFESNCHHHESGRRSSSPLAGFFCVPLRVRTFRSQDAVVNKNWTHQYQ